MTGKELFKEVCEKISKGQVFDVDVSQNLHKDILLLHFFDSVDCERTIERTIEIIFNDNEISIYG